MRNRVVTLGRSVLAELLFATLLPGTVFGLQNVSGLIVEELAGKPAAAETGIQPGDRIVSYDGKALASPAALDALQENLPGKSPAVLSIWRGEERFKLTIPPGALSIRVRPQFPPDATKLYEAGRLLLKAGKTEEAVAQWKAAAKLTRETDTSAAAWLYGRVEETLESQGRWKKAGDASLAAWDLLRQSTDPAARSRILSALGRCRRKQNDFTAARRWFEQARQVDLVAGNEMWVASDLSSLGLIAEDEGEVQMAQDYFSRSLAVRERLAPGSLAVAASLVNLGNVAQDRGDLTAAEKYHSRALSIRQRLAPGSLIVANSLIALGIVANDRGDLAAAQDYHSRALATAERLAPNSLNVANCLNELGIVARNRGELAAAQDYHSRSLAIKERLVPNSLDVASSLNNLGIVAWARGDLAAAQEYHSRSLAIKERLAPDSLDVAASLNNLGNVAWARGDLGAAQEYHSRSLAIKERLAPGSLDVASSLTDLGAVAKDRGDLATAQAYLDRALVIQRRLAPDSGDVADSLDNLGAIAKERGNLAAARDYFSRSLAIHERLAPNSLDIAANWNDLGEVAAARGDLQVAQDYFRRGLQIRERLAPGSADVAESLIDLGDISLRRSDFSNARLLFIRAVAIVESQRGRISSSETRAFLVAKYGAAYEGLVRACLAVHDVPAAFLASERAKARSLMDLLTEARVKIRQGVDPSLLERELHLQEFLNAKADHQTRLLSGKHSTQEAAAAAAEIDALTNEYHEAEARIRASSPHYAALTQIHALTLDELQRQVLDKDSLLLEYSLGDEASILFAISQHSIGSYLLPKRAEIETLARQVYDLLTTRNQRKASEPEQQRNARVLQAAIDYPRFAARLTNMVLAPAAAQLGTKRLLIVADGALLQIPFAALADPLSRRPQPLLMNHEIVSLPSASVLAIQRRELANRKPAARQLALFADPVFEPNDERVKAIARTSARRDAGAEPEMTGSSKLARAEFERSDFERAITEVGIRDERSKIQRLPFSREEANAIFTFARQQDAREALDFEANKRAATSKEISQYRIVHFATHALLNNDHPELSGIVLSLVNRQGEHIDGFLRLNEIYNLNLPADLVVLSACQTALGRQIRGEGLIGLTRGFFYAGTERVVASLWNVDDEATAELMKRFYEKLLKERQPTPAALRRAQLEMTAQKRWNSAYYWAGFEAQGEWK